MKITKTITLEIELEIEPPSKANESVGVFGYMLDDYKLLDYDGLSKTEAENIAYYYAEYLEINEDEL